MKISPYEAYHIFDSKTLTGFLSIKTVGLAASICSSSPLHAMPELDHLAHVFTVIERLWQYVISKRRITARKKYI